MTEGMAALLLGILAIVYAIISTTSTKRIIENTNKFLEKMKQEDLKAEKEYKEMLERMDKRHEETMIRIAQLIAAKSEEIKELIRVK